MPQSLVKTRADAGQPLELNGRSLVAMHDQIVSVLRQRLGSNHGELLATPKLQPDGGFAWSSVSMATPVLPAAELPEAERDKLQTRAERMLAEIRGLAEALRTEGPASQIVAQMLESAIRQPPGDWLYSVGGKPVLVMWGHDATGSAPVPLRPPTAAAPGVAAAASAATAATAAPMPTPPAVPAPSADAAAPPVAGFASPAARPAATLALSRWLPWAMLALLAVALLLWGLRSCNAAAQPDAALAAQLAEADERTKTLEDELARQRRDAATQLQCVPEAQAPSAPASSAPPEPPAAPPSAPEPAASAAPPPASAASAPRPLDELKRRIAAAGKNCDSLSALMAREPLLKAGGKEAATLKQQMLATMAQNCREAAIREAKNACPGQRPKELAPDMAIVFDASGSMNFSLDVTEAQIRAAGQSVAAEQMMRMLGIGGMRNPVMEQLTREPRRITVAKRAAQAVVGRLPSDMSTGLVMVDQCPAARSVGYFSAAQRGSMLSQLQAIEPRQGTPLADGLAKAGQLVDGVNRESTILVISDGTESCNGDPCATAAALKRAKPHLKINVVDITGTGAGNCVAQATGGKVYTANNADELVAQTNRAAQDAMGPASCKR